MRFLLLTVLLMLAAVRPGEAADAGISRKAVGTNPAFTTRVIPRSPQASLVWAADACWRGCAHDCGRQFQVCLTADRPENCIAQNDACDRFCQRECRLYGGPLLPLD